MYVWKMVETRHSILDWNLIRQAFNVPLNLLEVFGCKSVWGERGREIKCIL